MRVQRLAGGDLRTHISRRVPLAAAPAGVESYGRDMSAGKLLLVADPAQVSLGPSR